MKCRLEIIGPEENSDDPYGFRIYDKNGNIYEECTSGFEDEDAVRTFLFDRYEIIREALNLIDFKLPNREEKNG